MQVGQDHGSYEVILASLVGLVETARQGDTVELGCSVSAAVSDMRNAFLAYTCWLRACLL